MRDANGISRGPGFVAFSTPEEASRSLSEMNGRMVGSKPLYVAHVQRKEERRARLQAQFSQMLPVPVSPSVTPCVPIYPTGAPGIGHQLFYGQSPPTLIPPQPGFSYQQQLVPGMRPGGAPIPNFFVPLVQPGQQTQRPWGRRAGAGPRQQLQQPMPLLQQQMLPRGRLYRYLLGRICLLFQCGLVFLEECFLSAMTWVACPSEERLLRVDTGRSLSSGSSEYRAAPSSIL